MVAFASATQDIVIDAYRVESLAVDEQAAGMAGYVAAYRIGMLASGAGVIGLTAWLETRGLEQDRGVADRLWRCRAAGAGRAAAPCCWRASRRRACAEPRRRDKSDALARVLSTARDAFADFLSRDAALAVLAFVVLYKLCDALAGAMTAPFVLSLGYDKATYAAIVKGAGPCGPAGRRLCRRRRGARAAAGHGAVARRHPADGLQPGLRVALAVSRRARGR